MAIFAPFDRNVKPMGSARRAESQTRDVDIANREVAGPG